MSSSRTRSKTEQLAVIEPVWPRLTVADAKFVLERFNAPAPHELLAETSRIITSSALVGNQQHRFFTKRFHTSAMPLVDLRAKHRAVQVIAAELDRVRERAHAPRIAVNLTAADGDTVAQQGEWLYELTREASGEDRYRDALSWQFPRSVEDAEGLGAALAAVHRAAEAVAAELPADPGVGMYQSRFDLVPDETADAVERFVRARPALRDWLSDRGHNLAADLAAHRDPAEFRGYHRLPRIWVHGDMHVSNMTFDGHAVDTVFDYGLAAPATALYDLAIALERNSLGWVEITAGRSDHFCLATAEAILTGYQRIRPLSALERRLLPRVLSLAVVEQALNFIPYHLLTGRDASADWSYEVFFGFHAEWFRTAPGIRYLKAITDLANASAPRHKGEL